VESVSLTGHIKRRPIDVVQQMGAEVVDHGRRERTGSTASASPESRGGILSQSSDTPGKQFSRPPEEQAGG